MALPIVTKAAKAIPKDISSLLLQIFLGAVGLGGAYLIIRKIINRKRFNAAQAEFGKDTIKGRAVGFANLLFEAMHPTGISWLWDGTNEELMFKVAKDIHDSGMPFSEVAKMYLHLFKDDLFTEIAKELGGDDKEKFNQLLQTGTTSLQGIQGFNKNQMVIATMPAHVYNQALRSVKIVKPNTTLGRKSREGTVEGHTFLGFVRDGQEYFIEADKTILLEAL